MDKLTKEQIGDLVGDFTWDFGNKFFIETNKGNFVWSDPDYHGGTNIITPFNGSIKEFFKDSYGRDKGTHVIKDYCRDFIYGSEEKK